MLQRSSSKSSRQMLTIAQEDESSNDRLSHTNDSVRSSARPSAENMANELRDRRSRMSQGNRFRQCHRPSAVVSSPCCFMCVLSCNDWTGSVQMQQRGVRQTIIFHQQHCDHMRHKSYRFSTPLSPQTSSLPSRTTMSASLQTSLDVTVHR